MEPAITVRGLDHHFGEGEARRQVLFGLDLDIARGALVVLMGASGSGKTTLLTLLGGLRSVQAGSVRVLGREMAGASATALAEARRRMGFIFQAHNLHESLTAVQNVRLALDVHGAVPQAEPAAARALSLVGLEDRLHYHPARLSGGQKQRVAVARALAGSPEIIFADEPTAALDAENGLAVVALLKRLGQARGTTTLMVTHDNRVLDLADRILTMRDGRLMPA
ncbi:ATP-binding cassette domain-containing protein [Roseococcus thiosulfatophilus]|uniref:ATP-binding cassette domain-containing protein n=1 Tax=Roseococcus thiosulfatophilus TaxID=35813 RepID=UPI001A8F7EE4|nr:ATP-binding cassette domain-containing protein [Roseococcus thiosulfatophilus]